MPDSSLKYVGRPHRLVDGYEKVTGNVQFVADMRLPGLLHARPVLSPYAHARLGAIDKREAEATSGVVAVLTADDLVTRGRVSTSRNSAVLAQQRVVFIGQPVAVVVGETEAAVADALDKVVVEYEPLPTVGAIEQALRPESATLWPNGLPREGADQSSLHGAAVGGAAADEGRPNNVSVRKVHEWGNVEAGFAAADAVVERVYRTAPLHQAYLEPHAAAAVPDASGRGLTVYTSTQGAFIVRDELADILSLPARDIRVVPQAIGGGFGAKYGIVEPLTAAVALALQRPVRLVFSRSDDFLATTPAPAIRIELKVGARRDGSLTALQARVITNNGPYSFNHGGIVATLLGGLYRWPHLHIETLEVHSNHSPVGAYRAPGSPQASFALESSIDDLARELGLDPLAFRLQNAIEGGDKTGTGAVWSSAGLKECLTAIQAHPLWQSRDGDPDVGVGVAAGGWPTFTTPAEALCRVDHDGTVNVQVGNVDVSGNSSSFVLIAAEILGVRPEDVRVHGGDTTGAFGPNSGGSQVTYSVAGAVKAAAEAARVKLLEVAALEFEAAAEDIELTDGVARVKGVPDRQVALAELARRARFQRQGPGPIVGEGHAVMPEAAPAFTAHLVRLKVDRESGQITVLDYVAAQDVGFAINPLLVEGQMHGGIVQGLGMALGEAMIYDEYGQLVSGSFMDYGVPRMADAPSLATLLIQNPSPHGPYGARGIGEPPITAVAAAVGNAIRDLTGARLTALPMRPEAVWRAMQAKDGERGT